MLREESIFQHLIQYVKKIQFIFFITIFLLVFNFIHFSLHYLNLKINFIKLLVVVKLLINKFTMPTITCNYYTKKY